MIKEVPISWRHAIVYGEEAKITNWSPELISVNQTELCTLLPLTPRSKLREIRNWIHDAVGNSYAISAIFKNNDVVVGSVQLPHILRFKFREIDSAMLFKLTWY